jgi:hypothetical protein
VVAGFWKAMKQKGWPHFLRLGGEAIDVEEPNGFSISGDFREVLLSDTSQGYLCITNWIQVRK